MENRRIALRRHHHWERPLRARRRKPFYLRWWFYVPIGLLVLGVLAAGVSYQVVRFIYKGRADGYDLSQMSRMEAASILYDRNGAEFGTIFIQNRNPVSLDKVSPLMVKAVVAAEDNEFFQHGGVDYKGMLRAAISNWRKGRISQGASTVTQQLARNSFDLKEKSYQRKLVEVFLAQRIEQSFSKDQIMEMYLNRVYFGGGFYGVEAAARGYFGKSAAELDAGQCAMLAGLLKSPNKLSPWSDLADATGVRNFVLKRMNEMGFLSRQEYEQYSTDRLYVLKRTNPYKTSYAIDFIRQQAISALGFERAMNGGFRIYTTLDSTLQRAAERGLREHLAKIESAPGYRHETYAQYRQSTQVIEDRINKGNYALKMPEPRYLQGASVAFDNATGGILALVGGRDIRHSEYNRVIQARRPPGTAFTPFVFAAAYEKGIFPGQIVQDACIDNRFVMVGGATGILGEWGVEQAENEYEGSLTAREALARGKNAATVRLGFQVGLKDVKETAKKAGIASPLRDYANSFLGSSELTLEELTFAYITFAGSGARPKQPYMITRIAESDGSVVYQARPEKTKVLSPAAAFQVHAGLEDALRKGTGATAYTEHGLQDFPAAGKTGTAYNFTDTYFVGYTSAVTCGVWVGFDRPGRIYRGAFGKDLALPIWTKIMNAAAKEFPPKPFAAPSDLQPVEICRVSGLRATPKCPVEGTFPGVYQEYATAAEMPQIRCDVHGGGIRDYAKYYDENEWPRAVAAIDLSQVRPIAVASPPLLGFSDVYNAVRPGAKALDDESIPVARALPANGAADPEDALAETQAVQAAAAAGAEPAKEPEVRKAEAVSPLDAPIDTATIPVPPPAPINF